MANRRIHYSRVPVTQDQQKAECGRLIDRECLTHDFPSEVDCLRCLAGMGLMVPKEPEWANCLRCTAPLLTRTAARLGDGYQCGDGRESPTCKTQRGSMATDSETRGTEIARTLTPEESARLAEIRAQHAAEHDSAHLLLDPSLEDAHRDIGGLLAIIDSLTNGPAWRPVTETEPPRGVWVLVLCRGADEGVLARCWGEERVCWQMPGRPSFVEAERVEAWMPLPKRAPLPSVPLPMDKERP